ncbi:DedA family protein [Alphaproteobacteria bacterium]|jgi:membrane protein YqaA with SNARE-associated domain|nr:DedA family protein [Alphaproteobacteria bacterium]
MWNSLYIYIEKKSTNRYSQFFLSLIAFIESIFFPIPPDVVLIPIIHFNKKKFLISVINCTLFSILGGALGYFLGLFLFDSVKNIFDLSKQELFFNFYNQYGLIAIFLGGFTPIPYKIIAITSGYANFNFIFFILLSLLSRGLRFFIIGYLVYQFGDYGVKFIKKNKTIIFLIIPLFIILGIYLLVDHG